jgi:hypothetical protein
MRHAFLALFPLIFLTNPGCLPTDNCSPRATRCDGGTVEICGSDRNWRRNLDCDDVSKRSGRAFSCQSVKETTDDGLVEGYTCLPANTQEAVTAAGGAK